MTVETSLADNRSAFQLGVAEGHRLVRDGRAIPVLESGPYSVGLLYAYRVATRRFYPLPPTAQRQPTLEKS